jgi:hypothetical protein
MKATSGNSGHLTFLNTIWKLVARLIAARDMTSTEHRVFQIGTKHVVVGTKSHVDTPQGVQ